MNIAIVGAGFAGMATAWNLLQHSCSVTFFDRVGIGGGASGVSAGLVHPFSGLHAKLNRRGFEGMCAAQKLFRVSEETLGRKVSRQTGLLRVALTEQQKKDYAKCAKACSEVKAVSVVECSRILPSIVPAEGIWIPSGLVVNSPLYLQGLWEACKSKGAKLVIEEIKTLEQLHSFDIVLIAMGAASNTLPGLEDLPLSKIKGQVIESLWPESLPPLTVPVSSQAYLLMSLAVDSPERSEKKSCLLGATFERDFPDERPDLNKALKELIPKIDPIFPQFKQFPIIDCRVGIRASTPHHHPLIKKVGRNCWVFTGLGSKGLLYHALFAEEVSSQIIKALMD